MHERPELLAGLFGTLFECKGTGKRTYRRREGVPWALPPQCAACWDRDIEDAMGEKGVQRGGKMPITGQVVKPHAAYCKTIEILLYQRGAGAPWVPRQQRGAWRNCTFENG